jgi:hypothetical protein
MSNLFTSLGFDVRSDGDIDRLAQLASRDGDPLAALAGYYLFHKIDSYIELWGQATPTAEIVGCVPHYAGESRLRLGVGDLISRRDHPLDGSVYGWSNPSGSRSDNGDYPLVVRIPDFDIFRTRVRPHEVITLQITAYAGSIDAYADDRAFDAAQTDRMRMAPQSFIPAGLFADTADIGTEPAANAIFSGHVLRAEIRVNGLTGHEYYHLLVTTFGGTYDVVASRELLAASPAEGSVVRGSFWLTGRLSA